jgi:Zn-dependent peptidase ImmA (M78 family)
MIINFPGDDASIEVIAAKIRSMVKQKIRNYKSLEVQPLLKEIVSRGNGMIELEPDNGLPYSLYYPLVVYPDKYVITLSRFTTAYQDNVAIVHRWSHLILHLERGQEITNFPHMDFRNPLRDWQANRFALAFLMPPKEFLAQRKEFKDEVNRLSGYFSVPESSVEQRMKQVK